MRIRGSPAYVAATVVRAGAMGLWGLFVPALLSIRAYGQYGILAATILITAQLAMLGTPQTIVSRAGLDVPLLGLMLHAFILALVAGGVTALALPAEVGWRLFPLVVAATVASAVYKIFGARARARLSFGTALGGETAVALTLAAAAVALHLRAATCTARCPSAPMAIAAEAGAFSVAALVLIGTRSTRIRTAELGLRGTPDALASVYSVGVLTVMDLFLWRRLEVYFLQSSPDGVTGVAVFTLAVQFATLLQLIPVALLDTWQPQLAMLWRQDRERFRLTFAHIERRYLLITGAIFLVGVPASLAVVLEVFPKYTSWLWLIGIIAASRILFAVAGLYSSTMYALALQRHLYLPVLIGSTIAVLANFAFTLPLGLRGAPIAYLCAQGAVGWLTWQAFRRSVHAPVSPPAPGAVAEESRT